MAKQNKISVAKELKAAIEHIYWKQNGREKILNEKNVKTTWTVIRICISKNMMIECTDDIYSTYLSPIWKRGGKEFYQIKRETEAIGQKIINVN